MAHDLPTTTYKIDKNKVDSEYFRNKLKLKNLETENNLFLKHPQVRKFFDEKGLTLGNLRNHSAKVITTGALTGSLLFAMPGITKELPTVSAIVKNLDDKENNTGSVAKQADLLSAVRQILPQKVGPLTRTQEKTLEQVFRNIIGVDSRATLEGEHLNSTYGFIGAEQHLARYPGDSMYTHPKTPEKDEGMAPGLGAWGYFTKSKTALTDLDIEREKWYVVVQTLYLPDWKTRLNYVRDWYKYRKVLVVNTQNGNAVVADIADSGPAAWTGKQFGGSPEVMNYLGGPNYKKGAVVIFFVDDPKNQVPLGPVDYNDTNISKVDLKNV